MISTIKRENYYIIAKAIKKGDMQLNIGKGILKSAYPNFYLKLFNNLVFDTSW